jgi:uncharacterized protein DUF4440
MKHLTGIVLMVFVATAIAAGKQAAPAADRAAIEKQLIANERTINEAVAKNDMKTFNTHVDAQGYGIDPTGIMKVADMTPMFAQMKITSWNLDQSKIVWVDNNTAVHMYRWEGKGTFVNQGKTMPVPSPTWASTVWTNRGGKWVAVFHQESAALETPPAKK